MQHLPFSLPPMSEVKAEIDRRECRKFSTFLQRAWPHVDPQPYVHGWHMDALSEHLQACAEGEILRLLINIAPGTSKSSATSVFFPAWLWGPFGWPEAKIIGASYEQGLAVRDTRKNRQLVESDWYQQRWPLPFAADQNEKTYFENAKRGFRQASAVKSVTGKRGDFNIWDDPLSPEKAYSETERDTANRVFAETLPLRMIDPARSVIIIIMQRLHENDVSGYILARELGYEHLCLPMEFEADRRCVTSIGWQDPRTEEGELLFPGRFPREIVERDKKVMGSFAVAGQFQQRPVPREGGMFERTWFNPVQSIPAGTVFVRGWDLAGSTKKNSPYTAGVKIGRTLAGRYVVAHAKRGRWKSGTMRAEIKSTAAWDGEDCVVDIPQDPGQAGKDQAQDIVKSLAGYNARTGPESGDKETRAMPFAAQAEAGNVDILVGEWNADYLDELCSFPFSEYKDQADASSRAFMALTKRRKSSTFAAPVSVGKPQEE